MFTCLVSSGTGLDTVTEGMIFLVLLLAFCGDSESCTEIGQVCYKCRGNIYTCNDGSYFYSTAEECISYVMSSSTKLSAHFKPSNARCFSYTCTNNMYFSDSTRFTIRKTCNGDCTNFTLTANSHSRVTDAVLSSYTASVGDCFEDCFETVGCYAFSYGGSVCSIYTSCGTSCSTTYQYGTTVYTRTCHTQTDCGSLNSPLNGAVDTSAGTTYNNQATYTCSTGYTLTGANTRTCQSDGQWSGSEPSCYAEDCGTLTSPTNGAVDTSSGTTYSNQATYTCSTGYTLTGTNTRTCQSDGQWSGSEPSCNAEDCGTLTSPTNGSVDTSSGTTYSSQATYTCSTGYTLTGTSIRTCQSDGQWNGSEPSCNAEDCGTLTSPTNGAVDTSSGTTYNNQATYNCSTGYTLTGTSTRTCQSDGQWSGSEPSCNAEDCGTLASPANGTVDTSSGTTYNNQATYTCSTGYTLTGTSTRTCQSDGQWSGSEPNCNAEDCGTLTSPTNGAVHTSSGTSYNNQATYTCSPGYTLVGTNIRTCQSDGQWSGSEPACDIKDCGTLTSPTNGAVNMTSGTTYNNQVTYTCSTGYRLVGTNTRTCQAGGQWSGSEPSCDAADCGTLTLPPNGTVDTSSGTTYNSQATYTCSDGYTLVGISIRTCQANGQWSGSEPACAAKDCGLLTSPQNGFVDTSNGTTYSFQAVYNCSTGYVMLGNSSRICQSNGQWSGSEPSCSVVDCGSLSAPDHGEVQNPANTTYLEEAKFSCFAGYNLTGNDQRTCQSSGSWSGTSPTCNPVDCGTPIAPSNGGVVATNGTTYGQNATFSCDEGFTLNGIAVTTCTSNGFWDLSPSCNVIDCGFLATLEHGVVEYPAGTTYGEIAYFQCDTGYYLSHLNNRTCQSSGQWSMSTPMCIQNGMPIPVPDRLYIAPCICYPNNTFTNMTQEEIINYLIRETSIERNSTALARNKLNCAQDSRLSSQIVGYAGIFIITGALGLTFLADVITFCQTWSFRRRAENEG